MTIVARDEEIDGHRSMIVTTRARKPEVENASGSDSPAVATRHNPSGNNGSSFRNAVLPGPHADGTTPKQTTSDGIAFIPSQDLSCGACRSGLASFPFSMAFQPIVDLETCQIDAFEALVRGPAGEGASHVLSQVNAENVYAFDQTCRVKAIELASSLGIACRLNINFLPNAVYQPRACIRATLDAASRTGFPAHLLTFEIVESEAVVDPAHLLNIVREYKRQGFSLALDDFGTGTSGFLQVAELQPDIVKVDRALIQGCDRDKRRLAIIASLIALGREIGIKIVLEGMERPEEVVALRSVGGRFMQGFYFGKPLFEKIATRQEIFGQR